jgi:hypothetical protein
VGEKAKAVLKRMREDRAKGYVPVKRKDLPSSSKKNEPSATNKTS